MYIVPGVINTHSYHWSSYVFGFRLTAFVTVLDTTITTHKSRNRTLTTTTFILHAHFFLYGSRKGYKYTWILFFFRTLSNGTTCS